ncbi:MAG TPA: NADH:ubiquinone oxidoreductase [bacterium]|nr:NADH:ubiquinone oxidoreductase [bacterium]HQN72511.1 NADH:ubiquinone oxidoreductase [bacterium]HQO92199.1 NADH:ubiquinone oxidoreductase [bacterium]
MIDFLKLRRIQGKQYIEDDRKQILSKSFRGFPLIGTLKCPEGCSECVKVCEASAVTGGICSIDLGKCTLCGDCSFVCPQNKIVFSNGHHLATDSREKLIITEGSTYENWEAEAVKVRNEIKNVFGRSFKLRSVSAGGCNGCELEFNACSNVNFDMGRFGIEFVASPRHADAVVISGPLSENMAFALEETYNAIPEPKFIIAAGACAISGGIFAEGTLDRSFFDNHKVDLYIPGCPVHPLTFVNALLDFTRGKQD